MLSPTFQLFADNGELTWGSATSIKAGKPWLGFLKITTVACFLLLFFWLQRYYVLFAEKKYRKAQKSKIKHIYHQREPWKIFWHIALETLCVYIHPCTHFFPPKEHFICGFFKIIIIIFIVVDFVIHWNETAMGLHVFPIPIPPPTFPSTRSLWVFRVHQVRVLVSCIQPGLVICFTLDNIHVSMLFPCNIPHSPSPTESKRLFYTSVSLFLFCI